MLNSFEPSDNGPEPRRVQPDEARALSQAGSAILLDIRDAHLFENAHLESAMALPLAEITALDGRLPARIAVTDQHVLIPYCACSDDGLAIHAAQTLIAAGYPESRVAVLAGGIKAWHKAGHPIVRWDDPSQPPDA